ncbi:MULTISPECIES: DUF2863 family protein [unclassified Undibacterium]|uniref:DUF2863 family protein n=1 Tax=unclassified Undibacterium TaxID=2630295 RepID=UPI002AC8B65B|nr:MULTISPECIES: DUF2863 family protein [unclassified Undibacterium]MEB0140959.1 DUF2863 family protein [Undibacterium sp. CCC2.1]MEB0173334.1 DUF2863 family protein [Undibacterium sp. CCC1.1]MEB0177915.1 DUF2863 family protein [Undibacterium sp. CCC3.4]MEB0217153.1 DUF2863 family protein [Undibacterium sp. 5I2]WPX43108.1 DUF2863 family protein [Undibacterium sp. CCC3.4]
MRRPIKRNRLKLAAESQRLVNLSLAVAQSASRLEDLNWQDKLDAYVSKNLKLQHQEILDGAAENLFAAEPNGYDVLIETLESMSSSAHFEVDGQAYDALLIAAPVLAWTRFEIASGAVAPDMLQKLIDDCSRDLLTADTSLRLLPNLYSIDQLPRNHCETYSLMERHALAIIAKQPGNGEPERAQTVPFLADIRYLLGILVTPAGAPLFQWQTLDAPYDCVKAKNAALLEWQQHAALSLQHLLPGCGLEVLLPEAYYTACREADIKIRPASLRSAVFYLTQTLGKEAGEFSVVIAACGVQETPGQIDEFRVSFCLRESGEVVYGVVWPLYQAEDQQAALSMDDNDQIIGDIPDILLECGISDILPLDEIFAMEFCDDCGTPLFADREAELVHPEMPEDTPTPGTAHFH